MSSSAIVNSDEVTFHAKESAKLRVLHAACYQHALRAYVLIYQRGLRSSRAHVPTALRPLRHMACVTT